VDLSHRASIANLDLLSAIRACALFSSAPIGYHVLMISLLATLLVRILELMFAVGVIGSTVVLVLTAIEDLETLFGREETHHS
jgi:hypothetical protein